MDITPRCVLRHRCGADVVATGITPRFDGKMIALVLVAAPSLQISRRALAAPAAAALVSQYAAACEAVVAANAVASAMSDRAAPAAPTTILQLIQVRAECAHK